MSAAESPQTQTWDGEERRVGTQPRPSGLVERRRGHLALVRTTELPASFISEDALDIAEAVASVPHNYVEEMQTEMAAAGENLRRTIATHPLRYPAASENHIGKIVAERVSDNEVSEQYTLHGDWGEWRPGNVYRYDSTDPWKEYNPERTVAIQSVIEVGMRYAALGKKHQYGELAYPGENNIRRSRRGKTATALTQAFMDLTDPDIAEWTRRLPAAEGLQPVGNPWSETMVKLQDDGTTVRVPVSEAMRALSGGSNDGWGVRERTAWVDSVLEELEPLLEAHVRDTGELVISSIGTGTGESVLNNSIRLAEILGQRITYATKVYGFDLSPASIAIAKHIANERIADVQRDITFFGSVGNVMSRAGITASVRDVVAKIYEGMGFGDYIADDEEHAPTTEEKELCRSMQRMGSLSAPQFYGAVYEDMPRGSIFLTGNMDTESPQVSFVEHGLGWSGIIPRSAVTYLDILRRADIPQEAVKFYVPGPNSSRAYNLAAITKL